MKLESIRKSQMDFSVLVTSLQHPETIFKGRSITLRAFTGLKKHVNGMTARTSIIETWPAP